MSRLTLSQGQAVLRAALAKAEELGSPSSVVVLDDGREMVAFGRQDGAILASIEVSMAKAYTAMSVRRPTADLTESTRPGQPLYGLEGTHQRPLVAFAGGVPLRIGTEVVGSVGVAGGALDVDTQVAQAGVDVLANALDD